MSVHVRSVGPGDWDDVEAVFGPNGAYSGCWCIWWQQTNAEFDAAKGARNRDLLRQQVETGTEPGMLAYLDGEPAGWIALRPRPAHARIFRSPLWRPDPKRDREPDDESVFSVTCFVVRREHRGQGLTTVLLGAAVDRAGERGAVLVEGYAVVPRAMSSWPDVDPSSLYAGTVGVYERAGFTAVDQPSPTRRRMHRTLG